MRRVGAAAIVLVALATTSLFWFATDVTVGDAVRVTLAWAWAVMLPGWVVARAVWGKPRQLVADLGIASGIGMVLGTVLWLVLVALGLREWFLAWPLLTLPLLLVAHRSILDLRPFQRHMGIVTAAGLALVIALIGGSLGSKLFATSALPGEDMVWYPDLAWHLGLVHELGRAMPAYDPQVFGEPFWYHWFANAHVASLAAASGVDPLIAFTRLWQPFTLVTVAVLLVVGAEILTGRLWPGIVANVVAFSYGVHFTDVPIPGLNSVNIEQSPSHQWALVPMLLCLIAVAELLRTERRRGPVILFTLGTIGLVGGKASSIPVLICGLLAVVVLSAFVDRARVKWHLLLIGIAAAGLTTSLLATAAANAGGGLQLLSTLSSTGQWQVFTAGQTYGFEVTPVVPGMELPGAGLLVVLIMANYLLVAGASWTALPLLRRDLAAWFMLAVGAAGFAAMFLVKVGGESQQYFMRGALPAWALLAALGFAAAWRAARRSFPRGTVVLWTILGAAVGRLVARIAAATLPPELTPSSVSTTMAANIGAYVGGLLVVVVLVALIDLRLVWLVAAAMLVGGQQVWSTPFIALEQAEAATDVAAALLALGAAVSLVLAGRRAGMRWPTVALTLALLVAAASVVAGNLALVRAYTGEDAQGLRVSAQQGVAAAWVDEHVDEEALLATNVHCVEAPETPDCLTQGFWVAGLTGHRVLIGGWSYTPPAHEAHGENGLPSRRQPFHDAELYELNQRAFTDPTPRVLERLRERGVDVLFGVWAHTEVSPKLDRLATELYRNDEVVVYSLER